MLPKTLFFENKIHIPPELTSAYATILQTLGLLQDAHNRSPENSTIIGGSDKEATLNHFTYRFPASASRIEYLFLNPKSEFGEVSKELQRWLSFGNVWLLDLPCGTGAASLSLLSTIAELRKTRTLPPIPLTITLLAADISPDALEIYKNFFEKIEGPLRAQNIEVKLQLENWDFIKPEQTARLIDIWFQEARPSAEYIVLISAMSGPLKGNIRTTDRWFNHLLERLHNRSALVTWIEPGTRQANNIMTALKKFFLGISWFSPSKEDHGQAEYYYFHPIKKSECRGQICLRFWSKS
ncbi:MAG: hypothetical protein HQM08_01390 [Candidatus Riflebacteria bacterium]|nr:hypothetical protein [Candidatus Riflebacteria bacterium]